MPPENGHGSPKPVLTITRRRPLRDHSLNAAQGLATTSCETRCTCGSLLARLVGSQVELKCRRCKQTTLIPLIAAADWQDA